MNVPIYHMHSTLPFCIGYSFLAIALTFPLLTLFEIFFVHFSLISCWHYPSAKDFSRDKAGEEEEKSKVTPNTRTNPQIRNAGSDTTKTTAVPPTRISEAGTPTVAAPSGRAGAVRQEGDRVPIKVSRGISADR